MKRFSAILLAAIMVAFSSCSKEDMATKSDNLSDSSVKSEEATGLAGMWSVTDLPESAQSITYTFNDDGTGEYKTVHLLEGDLRIESSHKLVWELEEGLLTMQSRLTEPEDYYSSFYYYGVYKITDLNDDTMSWQRTDDLTETIYEVHLTRCE